MSSSSKPRKEIHNKVKNSPSLGGAVGKRMPNFSISANRKPFKISPFLVNGKPLKSFSLWEKEKKMRGVLKTFKTTQKPPHPDPLLEGEGQKYKTKPYPEKRGSEWKPLS